MHNALKIEDLIHRYVQGAIELPPKLVVSFLVNVTTDVSVVDGEMHQSLQKAYKELSTYPTHKLDTFFWTSPHSRDYFNNPRPLDESFAEDNATASAWSSAASSLATSLAQTSSKILTYDPCGFASVTVQNHMVNIIMTEKLSERFSVLNINSIRIHDTYM
jgi:hypothetical protein